MLTRIKTPNEIASQVESGKRMQSLQVDIEPLLHHHSAEHGSADWIEHAASFSAEDLKSLLYRMHNRQIELELHNKELQQAQEAARKSRAWYFDLYQFAPVSYLVVDEQGIIQEANIASATVFGMPHYALIAQPLKHFIVDEDYIIYCQHLQQLSEEYAVRSCVLRIKQAHDAFAWVQLEAVVVPAREGMPRMYCVALTNNMVPDFRSEMGQADISLDQHEVLDSLPAQIALLDRGGTIVAVNNAWRRFMHINYPHDSVQRARAGVGANYLAVCRASVETENALRVYEGIKRVLDGTSESFMLDYECFLPADKRWFTISVAPLRTPHGGAVVTHVDITAHKQMEEALRTNQTQLQHLSQQLLHAQEAERRRLARELHDEVGQSLSMIKLSIELAQDEPAYEMRVALDRTLQLVSDTLQQVRGLALDLRPSVLDDLGLEAALRWYLDRSMRQDGTTVSFEVEHEQTNAGIALRLPSQIEVVCFRIVQEALTNIVRHAHAQSVRVLLRAGQNTLHLLILDDGIGFDVQDAYKRAIGGASLGMLSMQERVALAGGQLQIDSTPGKGTTLQVHFSLP